jgi:hypothetical protein
MKSKNIRYPSKSEVINTLLKEDPSIKKFNRMIVVVEHKKINKNLGITKGELIVNGKTSLKGSMTQIPETTEDSFDWKILKDGESYFQAFSINYKEEKLISLFKQGLKNSIKGGKIPFLQK